LLSLVELRVEKNGEAKSKSYPTETAVDGQAGDHVDSLEIVSYFVENAASSSLIRMCNRLNGSSLLITAQ